MSVESALQPVASQVGGPDSSHRERSATPILSAGSLNFSYGSSPVLCDVSLSLGRGELVALIGPNGSGKSTLLRCLLGQLPAEGDLRCVGKPLAQISPRALARVAAYLPQSPAAEAGQTVADVLRLGRSAYLGPFGIESAADVQVVLEVAASLELLDLLDRPIEALSGGQRQRVFLGRCLAQRPIALLLDEPDAHLDLKHQMDLGRRVRALASSDGLGVLMATHDLNLAARFADRLILLEQGRVVASGSAEAALDPALLSRVYGLPMGRVNQEDGAVLVFPSGDAARRAGA